MEDLLHEVLYPVLLGSNTLCHAAVRQFQKRLGVDCTVLTGKRALTLRFMPGVRLVDASPQLSDELLLTILSDLETDSRYSVPLLVLCDPAYEGFVIRNRSALESRFIIRNAADLHGGARQ